MPLTSTHLKCYNPHMTFRIGYIKDGILEEISVVANSKDEAKEKFGSKVGEFDEIKYVYKEMK